METASHYKRRQLRSLDTLPERLRELRELRGLSRTKFAELSRLNSAAPSRLETGMRTIRLAMAVRIANLLDVSLFDLCQPAGTVLVGRKGKIRLNAQTFAANLIRLREVCGLSVGALADRSCVSYMVIHQAENERRFPLLARVVRIAAVLGVSVDELVLPVGG